MSVSVIHTFADEPLLASNLSISFFPSYRFGVAVKGNSIVLKTYPSPTRYYRAGAAVVSSITSIYRKQVQRWRPHEGFSAL